MEDYFICNFTEREFKRKAIILSEVEHIYSQWY